MKHKKERLLLALSACILLAIAVFSILNWSTVVYLFRQMLEGVSIVEEYVLSLGVVGVLSIALIIIVCFFFPVISSIPVQLASSISYGLPLGILHVVISIFLASQLAFLFTRTIRVFQSEKQRQQQLRMEQTIQNSSRSIETFLILAYLAPFVPFLLIHLVAANSGMKWRKYALITLFGPVPDVVVTLWLGEKVTSSSSPIVSFCILMVIIACVVFSLIYKEKMVNWIFKPQKTKEHTDGK